MERNGKTVTVTDSVLGWELVFGFDVYAKKWRVSVNGTREEDLPEAKVDLNNMARLGRSEKKSNYTDTIR